MLDAPAPTFRRASPFLDVEIPSTEFRPRQKSVWSSLAQAAQRHAVLSVPREPNFRVLNFLRGQHFKDFGNAPGHVQHWSAGSFLRFVETEFEILQVKKLLPWTVVLASPRQSSQA